MILRACTGAELSGLRRLGISAAFVLVLAVGGCSQREQRAAPEPKPPTVSVTTAVARDIPVAYEFIGQTEATRRVEIRSRVPGFVLSREYARVTFCSDWIAARSRRTWKSPRRSSTRRRPR
jgi:hypothetical protein